MTDEAIKPPRAADCKWRSGPPPEIGWWPAFHAPNLTSKNDVAEFLRWYDGKRWSAAAYCYTDAANAAHIARFPTNDQHNIVWTDRWWLK